jgi:AAA+ superfamily predicted ATPase
MVADAPPTADAVPEKRDAGKALPEWYPAWAHELADLYFSGASCVFVLHGNVHDLIPCPDGGQERYASLVDFLGTHLFGNWDLVVRHDLSYGLRALTSDRQRLQSMMQHLNGLLGAPAEWPRNPDDVLLALDRVIERNLIEDDPAKRKSLGVIFEYGQYLVPSAGLEGLAGRYGSRLVRLLQWAQSPYIKRVNTAFCLVVDKLSEVNDRLVQSPHVATIEIPMPGEKERARFVQSVPDLPSLTEFSPEQLTQVSNGLSLISLSQLLTQAKRGAARVDEKRFRKLKKSMIERQCQGLLEFVEPEHTLDLVVGLDAAKKRLREDASFIAKGRLDAAPMGYLLCGSVGTGKTFLAECYAGSIGIPCVTLRNFRSKYVGESEGNLESVLTLLRSLGPVVVIVDEADAALGSREMEGDSGTSGRIFSMIASQMGNTRYRGKIIWMLLTSRPDLLPIDLKRQGRAEVHIPLFYPQTEAEAHEMFLVMGRKNKVPLTKDLLPPLGAQFELSGADIESILLAAKRKAMAAGRGDVSKEDLAESLAQFIPSSQGLEKEMQEIAAVLECTELEFLPESWRKEVSGPRGRSHLQSRMMEIKAVLEK